MERPWLKHYPPGVPAEIDPSRYPSLVAMLEESFQANAAKQACVCMGKTMTYAELDAASRAFAAWLQSKGLQRGARVAIMMPNVLQYPVAIAAILRAGLTGVNVNPLYKPRELEFQLKDSGAEAIIVLENFASVLQEALPHTDVKHVVVACMGDMLGMVKGTLVNTVVRHVKKMVPAYALPAATKFNDALSLDGKLPFTRVTLAPDDLACLQYTGGTTGISRGAMLSHGNLAANVRQINTWFASRISPGAEIVITALPLYHVYALTCNCFCYTELGGLNVLITDPRDLAGLVRELKRWKFSAITGVNTLYQHLASFPDHAYRRLLAPEADVGGRHGGHGSHGTALGRGHRQRDPRRLRPVRGLAGGDVATGRISRRTAALSGCRSRAPMSPCGTMTGAKSASARPARCACRDLRS